MKKLFLLGVLALLSSTVLSCSADDYNESGNASASETNRDDNVPPPPLPPDPGPGDDPVPITPPKK